MKILITGFKPFNNQSINPSLKVLEAIDSNYNGHQIYKLNLNVEYKDDGDKIIKKINEINPDLVLLLGEAGGRRNICLEYMGVNINSATIEDNKGELLLNKEIINGEDIALKTNVNVDKVINDLKDYKFTISYHAGTYVCNDIYYRSLNYIYRNNLNTKCAFIHFPFLKEQTIDKYKGYYSLELDEMVSTLYKIIDSIEE